MPSLDINKTSYLSLAVEARKALNALDLYSHDKTKTDELERALNDAASSLRALHSEGPLGLRLQASSSYEDFEQVQTLFEVESSLREEGLADRLAAAVSTDDERVGERNRELAYRFFSALENRALRNFRNPSRSALTR